MNIGYLRLNNPVELDFKNASPSLRGTEYRLGIFEALVENGHNLTVYSPVKRGHKHVFRGNSQSSMDQFTSDVSGVDYAFMEQVDYRPEERDIDEDVMIVECGPTSTLFGYSWDTPDEYDRKFDMEENVPFFWRTFDVLDDFSGHVVYHQHDIKLPFPFEEALRPPSDEAESPRNLTIMGNQINLFDDKRWTILLHSLNPQAVHDKYADIKRYSYSGFPLTYKVIPACYSENIDQRFEPRELSDIKHDLVYIGGPKDSHRKSKIQEFYDLPGYDVGIVGGWDKEDRQEVGTENIFYYGRKGGHQDVYRFQNWGLATVNVADELLEDAGQITNRVVSTARGGGIVLMDEDIECGDRYVDDEWMVASQKDVEACLQRLREMSYEERLALNENQLSNIPRWTEIDWGEVLSHHPDNWVLVDGDGRSVIRENPIDQEITIDAIAPEP